MKMKQKQMMLATATVPMLATGLILPMGNESVVQKVKAEGTAEVTQSESYVNGESFWQDKYNPWDIYFLSKKSDGKFYDAFYDGQKMVSKPAKSTAGYLPRSMTTKSGKVFSFNNPTSENLDGVYDPKIGTFKTFGEGPVHPFPKTSSGRYPTLFNVAEANGTLVANGGFSASWSQNLYYSYSKDDGETWINISTDMAKYGFFRSITVKDGKFYAHREHGGNSYMSSSEDGINWKDEYSFPLSYVNLFVDGDNVTAITGYNVNVIYKSNDGGKTFSQHAKTQPNMQGVTYKDGKFIGYVGDKLYHSDDAVNWELTKASVNGIRQVYVDSKNDRFIILASNYVAISKDGEQWTKLDINIPENVFHLKFAESYEPLPIQEKKTVLKTVNDSLPLGDKFWEADTSHIFMSYINTPRQLPEGMSANHARLINPRDVHIKKDGKMIHGYRDIGGFTTYNIEQSKYNPALKTYSQAGQFTTGLRMTDAIVLKDGRIASTFMTSYKGTPKGIAFFNADDFTGEKRGEVLPTDVVPISYKNYTPVKVVEGDGYIGVLSIMLLNQKYTSVFHVSTDEGKTWNMSNEVAGRMNDIEMTEDGKIVLFGDANLATGYPAIATSEDGGSTFENIQGIKGMTEDYGNIHRSSLHNVAYRDGVYVWSFGRPYVSTDLVNWTPVRPNGERTSQYDIKGSTVEYDPINDAFVLSFENYLGISRDGLNWRELHVHNRSVSQTDFKYHFEGLTMTSDELTKNGAPVNNWQTETTAKDETAPTASVAIDSEDWTSRHATIQVSGIEDEGQGFDYMVLPDGTISKEPNISFVVTENGSYSFKLYDKAGNMQEYVMDVKSIDKTPATIEVGSSTDEWTNQDVELTVVAKDEGSGVAHIELPTGEKIEGDTANLTVSENGEVVFKAVDKAGNESEYRYEVNNIDREAATATVEADVTSPTQGNVVISLQAEDAGSGVKSIELPDGTVVDSDMATFTAEENGTYTFVVTDKAGNVSEFTQEVTNIDREVGETTLVNETIGWTNEFATIQVEATDAGSGVDYVITPEGEKVTSESFEFEAEENGTYAFTTVDKAGNEWTESVTVTNIDKTVGSGQVTPSTTKPTNAKFGVVLTAEGADAESGMAYVILPNGVVVSGDKADYTVHANGEYTFVFIDHAGNSWSERVSVSNLKGNAYRAQQDPTSEQILLPNGKVWKGKAPQTPPGLAKK